VRIRRYQFQNTKGLNLTVDNNRLDPIHQIRIIVSDAQSFDASRSAFRTGCSFSAAVITQPNIVQPSCSGNPVWLIRKETSNFHLLAGDDFGHLMSWPENDKSEMQRWRLSLRVLPMTWARNSAEKSAPLRELVADIVARWDKATNEFSIEKA
jgi:hypothetical protein